MSTRAALEAAGLCANHFVETVAPFSFASIHPVLCGSRKKIRWDRELDPVRVCARRRSQRARAVDGSRKGSERPMLDFGDESRFVATFLTS